MASDMHGELHTQVTVIIIKCPQGSKSKVKIWLATAVKVLFVSCMEQLSFHSFRSLYDVNYSPEGSNYHTMETDAIFMWVLCLQTCEGWYSNEGSSIVPIFKTIRFRDITQL